MSLQVECKSWKLETDTQISFGFNETIERARRNAHKEKLKV